MHSVNSVVLPVSFTQTESSSVASGVYGFFCSALLLWDVVTSSLVFIVFVDQIHSNPLYEDLTTKLASGKKKVWSRLVGFFLVKNIVFLCLWGKN